jgi:hypothetical protein
MVEMQVFKCVIIIAVCEGVRLLIMRFVREMVRFSSSEAVDVKRKIRATKIIL